MMQTIRVATTEKKDPVGMAVLARLQEHKIPGITHITAVKVYRLEDISEQEAKRLAEVAFCESINQQYSINTPVDTHATTIEIAYKPGVMNPEVTSVLKVAADLHIQPRAADTSVEYNITGTVTKDVLQKAFQKSNLYNPLIEHIVEQEPHTFVIEGHIAPTKIIPLRTMSDTQLMHLSKDTLFLNMEEMQTMQRYFQKIKRDPTDCELEILAQTWSEHCVHKTFKATLIINGKKKQSLINRIKKTAKKNDKRIISAFVDNSGVIDFFDGYAICGKVETHNSPSAIEPYGGAMTGSGGVFRDVLGTGKGAKIVAASDIFCFAPPTLPKKDIPPGCLPPTYILKQVIAGVRDYGNRVGIPTNNGSLHFHPDFRAKPTVAVGAFGIMKKKQVKKGQPKAEDLLITIGGKTGRDGIHGATFSSGEMSSTTKEVSGAAVQIGNAIEEKRMIDAVLAMSEQNLIKSLTDCGAGGYSSAIGELAQKTGAKVFLEKVPLKYPGLAPWEIFLSESQERMILVVEPKYLKKIRALASLYNVETTVIGHCTNTKLLEIFYDKTSVCSLSMEFLHDGLPKQKMVGKTLKRTIKEHYPKLPVSEKTYETLWKNILSDGTIASKEPIVRMYDHNVQGSTAMHPFSGEMFDGPNDGSIVRPLLHKPYGLVTTHGLNPILNTIDPYWGSIWALTEAVANYVAMGGDIKQAALIDNFIWPFPDPASLADLDASVDACVAFAKQFHLPFVSGKDSLSSTYRYPSGAVLKIPPVLLISVFGKLADVSKTVSSDFKQHESTIVLLGKLDRKSMGGSVYFSLTESTSSNVPKVDLKTFAKITSILPKAIQKGLVLSCHDISEGGMAATLAEMCFGGNMGATIDIQALGATRPDFVLFNETAGTFLVEVESEKIAKKIFKSLPFTILGTTTKSTTLTVQSGKKRIVSTDMIKLKHAWQQPMKEYFPS